MGRKRGLIAAGTYLAGLAAALVYAVAKAGETEGMSGLWVVLFALPWILLVELAPTIESDTSLISFLLPAGILANTLILYLAFGGRFRRLWISFPWRVVVTEKHVGIVRNRRAPREMR